MSYISILFAMILNAAVFCAQAATVTGGPMPGHATSRTASVWLQADSGAEARIEYWLDSDSSARALSAPIDLDASADFSARIELTGLAPDTSYRYAVFLDGQSVLNGSDLRLRKIKAEN